MTQSAEPQGDPSLPLPLEVLTAIGFDLFLGLGLTALILWLYPLRFALPLALLILAPLTYLAYRVRQGSTTGYSLQLMLGLGLSLRLAYLWVPFGLLLPGGLLFAWAHPDVRAHFGMEGGSREDHVPLPVALAIQLVVVQWSWLLNSSHHLFLGGHLGYLEPLSGKSGELFLLVSSLLLLPGFGLRLRLAYLLAPWILTPVVLSVYPLNWILLPCFALWLRQPVLRWFGIDRRRLWYFPWLLGPPLVGILLLAGVLSPGSCTRHGSPLRLYPYWQSPLFRGGEPLMDEIDRVWDVMRVTCPLDDLAVLHRNEIGKCGQQRMRAGREARSIPDCPFDAALRKELPEWTIPENQFEPEGTAGSHILMCTTCRDFGLFERRGSRDP